MKQHLKVHYFQHIAGEGFGSCYDFLKSHHAEITATEFFALPPDLNLEIEALPRIEDVDLLIIMGGGMSVNDEADYPWLKIEKRWIRRYLSAGKPAIGLCLGGQLIANALGASVMRNPQQELGWYPVYKAAHVPAYCFNVPEVVEVMHWHSDTFEIPKGGVRLAGNNVCHNQLYQMGSNVLGFQFHPEMTAQALELYLEDDDELAIFHGDYVQSVAQLRKSEKNDFKAGNDLLNRAIDYVVMAQATQPQDLEKTIA